MADTTPLLGAMDRPRNAQAKRTWPLAAGGVVLIAAVIAVASLRPAAAVVDRSAIVIDAVKRGPFVQELAAAGALVAEQPRLIAAPTAGRIEEIVVEPGDRLASGAIILRVANRETTRQLLEVEQQLAAAEAELADLTATLQVRSLESEKNVRHSQFEKQDARRQADAMTQLEREGLISQLEALRRREAADEAAAGAITESSRHAALTRSGSAQLDAQRKRVERLRALHAFHRGVVESQVVRAPAETTVREIVVQEGEWVAEGQRLLRLVEPGRLKCVLQVPEASANDVRIGQRVTMNARGAELRGEVVRIGAAVEQGTLPVDVRLEGELPSGARPDLSVEGRIEVSRVQDALSVARGVNASANSASELYKVDANGRNARRTSVRYGAASVDRIVIISGAAAGDRFIIAGVDGRSDPVVKLK